MLFFDQVKKLAGVLFKSKMLQWTDAEETTDYQDLETTSVKFNSMTCQLNSIMLYAEQNQIYITVQENYVAQGMALPTPQQLMSICLKCMKELCRAAGDITELRAVGDKYGLLF